MLKLSIPGFGELHLEHVVFDFNGTLAIDGTLIDGLESHLRALAKHFTLHVVTGDSSHTAKVELANIPCKIAILPAENQGIAKVAYIQKLNPEQVVAIGNGRNDQQMLKAARLGIAIVGKEGLAHDALDSATIIVPDILSAIYLLRDNNRLLATLRA